MLQTDTAKRPGPMPLRLDEEWQERARAVAEAKQRALHWVLVEAVKEYVIREEKRESFKQEAHARWEHYQQTGLHVTGEEGKAWMQKLIAGELAESPECHA
jgi:predicted transcriptional regulator